MSRMWPRVASIAIATTLLLSCSGATEPRTDVDLARSRWLARHPLAYSFEVATAGSWISTTGYVHVQVSNGQVVAATDPSGNPVVDFTLTVDGIWDQLLAAQETGQLNSVSFDRRGVPVESDMGPWAVDGGRHYSVRNFAAAR